MRQDAALCVGIWIQQHVLLYSTSADTDAIGISISLAHRVSLGATYTFSHVFCRLANTRTNNACAVRIAYLRAIRASYHRAQL